MHEVGIVESAMDTVRRHAAAQQALRVEKVVLRIGALSGVEPEALRFAFDVVTRGTIADGGELEIVWVPAVSYCAECQKEFSPDSGFIFVCPDCGGLSGEIRQGRELELTRIELTPTPCASNAAAAIPCPSA